MFARCVEYLCTQEFLLGERVAALVGDVIVRSFLHLLLDGIVQHVQRTASALKQITVHEEGKPARTGGIFHHSSFM